jgi:hypothetical protein
MESEGKNWKRRREVFRRLAVRRPLAQIGLLESLF